MVGAGPAGITASLLLAGRGYGVTLFDVMDTIGGALRYGIPEFRLHHAKLVHYKRLLDALGVKFRPNTRIGTYLTGEDLFNDGYDAVFVAGGAPRPQRLGLLGETLGHVAFAVDYLELAGLVLAGQRVAVVGAGNVAVDAARTALRKGSTAVTILNFMGPEEVAAYQDEVELALIDGVEFLHYSKTIRITDHSVKWMRVDRVEAEDGSVAFEDDFTVSGDVEADAVIIAVGSGAGVGRPGRRPQAHAQPACSRQTRTAGPHGRACSRPATSSPARGRSWRLWHTRCAPSRRSTSAAAACRRAPCASGRRRAAAAGSPAPAPGA